MAQKNAWHLFTPSSSYPNIQFSGTGYAPCLGTNFAQLYKNPSTPFTNYLATNVMTDEEGKLLFTVISTLNGVYLFDINNQLVGGQALTKNQGSKEIAIVPLNKGVLYHILTAGRIWQYDIGKSMVTELQQETGLVKINAVGNESYSDANLAVRLKYLNNDPTDCIAGYTCYWIRANSVGITKRQICKIDYRVVNNGNYGVFENYADHDIAIINGYSTQFWYYLTELEISPDGTKLAFSDNTKVFVYALTNNGYVSHFQASVTYGLTVNRRVAGLEFTPDSRRVVFSAFEPTAAEGKSNDLIYLWDFPNNTYRSFTASSNYARSAIETGKDGKIYVANTTGLYQLNLSALTVSSKIIDAIIFKTSDINKVGSPNDPNDLRIYNLPDQIDGHKIEYFNLSQTAHSIKNGIINWQKTINVPAGGLNWTNSSHTLTTKRSGKVFVLDKLDFKQLNPWSTGIITMDGMEIQYYDDAECNVYQGAGIHLKGTVFKGMDCGLMWKGVDLRPTKGMSLAYKSIIKMESKNSSTYSYIMDAYNGIKTLGKYGSIDIKSVSIFERNEININVKGIEASNLSINGASLLGATPLRDQLRGVNNYDDFDDDLYRTKTHILVAKSNVVIGSTSGAANWFYHAQHGVNAVASSVQLYNADMTNTFKYGCWFNANKESEKHELKVIGCNFHDLMQGIEVEQEAKATTIQKNKFNTTWAFAIDYRGNHGGKLLIGNETDTSLKNTFIACNWSAINGWDNAKFSPLINLSAFNSRIEIYNNDFSHQSYASAIVLAEPSNSAQSYGVLKIIGNSMGTGSAPIGQGILLKQIQGGNPLKAVRDPKYPHDINSMIQANQIKFTTVLNPNYCGINAENSSGLNFLDNAISANQSSDWRNAGIKCSEGKNNLVHSNILSAGKGLLITGNGIFSNYYCNTFNACVNGIQLGYSILRDKANLSTSQDDDKIHAHTFNGEIKGRTNTFNNTYGWGKDMHVLTDAAHTHAAFNQWDFTNSKLPGLSPVIMEKLMVHTRGTNPCGIGFTGNPQDQQITINYNGIHDPLLVWKLKYSINRFNKEGQTSQWVEDTNLIAIQQIEDKIHEQRYTDAQLLLYSFNPVTAIDSAFKTVFSIWSTNRLSIDTLWHSQTNVITDTFWMDSVHYTLNTFLTDTVCFSLQNKPLSANDIQILSAIAQLDALLVSPAAYPARAILWGEKQMLFDDPALPFYPNLSGYVGPCNGDGDSGIKVKLFDSLNVFTGIETQTSELGYFSIDGIALTSLTPNMKYYLLALLPNGSVKSQQATYTQLAMQSHHYLNCQKNQPFLTIQNTMAKEISIFPNPSLKGFTFVDMPAQWEIHVSDRIGKILWKAHGSGDAAIPFDALPKGLYTATIINLITHEQIAKKILVH